MSYVVKLFLLVLLLSGCSGQNMKGNIDLQSQTVDAGFRDGVRLGCNLKYKNNKEYCECFTNFFVKQTPYETKKLVVKGGKYAEKYLYSLLRKNEDKFLECNKLKVVDYSIPSINHTDLAMNILSANAGNILSPSDIENIKPLNLQKFEFQLVEDPRNYSKVTKFRLNKTEGSISYFDYVVPSEDSVMKNKYYWDKGRRYVLIEKDGKIITKQSSNQDSCLFVLGECEFKNYKGERELIYTEYRDGIWFQNAPSFGDARSIKGIIYDLYGFPLYEYSMSNTTGKVTETRRVETR